MFLYCVSCCESVIGPGSHCTLPTRFPSAEASSGTGCSQLSMAALRVGAAELRLEDISLLLSSVPVLSFAQKILPIYPGNSKKDIRTSARVYLTKKAKMLMSISSLSDWTVRYPGLVSNSRHWLSSGFLVS